MRTINDECGERMELRVLIVEDDEIIREGLALALRQEGIYRGYGERCGGNHPAGNAG